MKLEMEFPLYRLHKASSNIDFLVLNFELSLRTTDLCVKVQIEHDFGYCLNCLAKREKPWYHFVCID